MTRIVRIQKKAKTNSNCIYSRMKQRELSRFARMRKSLNRVSKLEINHVSKFLKIID